MLKGLKNARTTTLMIYDLVGFTKYTQYTEMHRTCTQQATHDVVVRECRSNTVATLYSSTQ